MKRLNLFALILVLCLVLSSCGLFGGEASSSERDTTDSESVLIIEGSTAGSAESGSEEGSFDGESSESEDGGTTEKESSAVSDKCDRVNFFMINDNHGSFVGDSDSVGVEKLANVLSKVEGVNGEYIKIANGDILQGSYISSTLRGLPMIEALNAMEFDCFVIGNHEFDWGIEKIAKYADGDPENGEADFPFLGANIYDKRTGERVEWMEPYVIVEYGGRKIGIIGVIGQYLESSILSSNVKNYEFVDYTELVADYASELRSLGCDVVVLSTHNYDEEDNRNITALSGESRIDAIFCGHTHRKINESQLRPDGYRVPIVENYGNGDLATSLILSLEGGQSASYRVDQYQVNNFSKDAGMTESVINKYSEMIEASYRVVGNTSSYMSKSEIGELCCNSMVEILGADVSMVNTGGVRADIQAGEITVAEIFASFPFENAVVMVTMTGSQLKALYDKNSEFLYFNTDFDPSAIASGKTYSVAVIDYVYEHNSYTSLFAGLPDEYTGSILRDLVIEYVEDTMTVSVVLPYYSAV